MLFYVLILGIMIIAAAVITLLLARVVARLSRKKPWYIRVALFGVVCLPFFWFLTQFGPADLTDPQDLAAAYELEFGTLPPSDVINIKCRQAYVGDFVGSWLEFQASPETVASLLKRFTPCSKPQFIEVSSGSNTPSWWPDDAENLKHYYRADNWNSDFDSSDAVIGYDPVRHVVLFSHRAIR